MIYLISDFFYDEITGGAESCNEAIYKNIIKKQDIKKIKSKNVTIDFLSKNINENFLIANFFQLKEECKLFFINNFTNKYILIEHDHKYILTNNPSKFPNFLVPKNLIINRDFYKNAKAVLAQSKIHSEIIQKNLLINNIINLAGNCWTDDQIFILEDNIDNIKEKNYAIVQTENKNKGMNYSIEYCKKNNIEYNLLPLQEYKQFIKNLSKFKNLIFFPQWLETFSRVSIEAKIVGCKLITNKLIGAMSDGLLSMSPKDLLLYIKDKSISIPNLIVDIFNNKKIEFINPIIMPKVTLGLSLYKGGKYIEKYMEDIVKQTIFDDIEFIIVDAHSPDNEYEIIKKYIEKYSNIKYERLDNVESIGEVINRIIKKSSGEYITFLDVDNFYNHDTLEVFRNHLSMDNSIDLVYADCIQTEKYGQNFNELKDAYLNLYEHSRNSFSPENMIKCLPGPISMWRKSIHDKVGLFNTSYKHAMDWEMWLRMVKNGSKFKKIDNFISGVYFFNLENGMSTAQKYDKQRKKEEAEIFFDYYHIFGNNGQNYIDYFWDCIK